MPWSLDAKVHANAPQSRQGHVAAAIDDKIFVWGGYSVLENGHVEFCGKEMCVYNMTADSWSLDTPRENGPATRTGASMVSAWGDMLIAFGGFVSNATSPHSSDVFFYDTTRKSWLDVEKVGCPTRSPSPENGGVKIHVVGVPPTPRDKHTACMYKNKMIVFGGWGPNPNGCIPHESYDEDILNHRLGWNNEVHVLDLSRLHENEVTWSKPVIKGKAPAPRAAHSMCVFGNKGVVFGGRTKNGRRNDTYVLNFDTWEWSGPLVYKGNECPPERSWHSATKVHENSLFVFGGLGKDAPHQGAGMSLGDAWTLNLDTMTWKAIEKPAIATAARLWHTCIDAPGSGQVIIFGGTERLDMQTCSYRLLRYKYSVPRLSFLCLDTISQRAKLLCNAQCLPPHLIKQLNIRVSSRPVSPFSRNYPSRPTCIVC